MEATFWNAILFALQITTSLVVFMMIIAFPLMMLASGNGWKAIFRHLAAGPIFGLKIGAYAVAPIIIGAILGWLTWLGQ